MKTIKQTHIKTLLLLTITLIFNACNEELGIDNDLAIPQCSSDIKDKSASLKILRKSVVKPLVEGTKVRVWHYDSSSKFVCTISGKAVIKL